jgi:hypothetical protein
MHKALVLGVLLVFALLGQASSGNRPPVSMSGIKTISVAATPQRTPVPPKKDIPNIPAVPKNPSLVAVTNMLNEAKEMRQHMRLYKQEMNKLYNDTTLMQNPPIRARVEALKDKDPSTKIDQLIEATANLYKTWLQVLNASGTK